jgi:hypothetical protein
LERLISVPLLSKMADARTLGTLAEQNAKKLGTYKRDSIQESDRVNKRPPPRKNDLPKHVRSALGSNKPADKAIIQRYIDRGGK